MQIVENYFLARILAVYLTIAKSVIAVDNIPLPVMVGI